MKVFELIGLLKQLDYDAEVMIEVVNKRKLEDVYCDVMTVNQLTLPRKSETANKTATICGVND